MCSIRVMCDAVSGLDRAIADRKNLQIRMRDEFEIRDDANAQTSFDRLAEQP